MSDRKPFEIAREALKQISVRKMLPTPANYQAIYNEIAGAPNDPPFPVERLRDTTEEDAVREGFPAGRHGGTNARNDFLCAWDDIYLNRGLASTVNPWVWRYEFGAENVEGEQ